VQVIRAESKHLELVAPLFDLYRQFYEQPSDLVGARDFISARLQKGDSVIFLALEEDGRALGFTQLYPTFSSTWMKRLWTLNDLFVRNDVRKKGVGQALMERARQWAVETGAHGLQLETAKDNHAAQRLYEGMGWKRDNYFYVYELKV
jgi:GNAT superfamily N-acetyltransferase